MGFIFTIIGLMVSLDILWWIVLARATNHAGRIVISIFMVAMLLGLVAIIAARMSRAGWDRMIPKFAVSAIFIWHFIGLGLLALIGVALIPILLGQKIISRRAPAKIERAETSAWSRRDFLRFTGAMLPPVFTFSLTGIAMAQLNNVRVRRFVLPIVDLPAELEGITIAQVSDMHVGRFTKGEVLEKTVRLVNEMQADLVLLTGDLINDALADLDTGLDLARRMEARFGLAIIEGNHDLIENPREFETRVRASGIPFLLDESMIVDVRGASVQLLGLSWTRVYGEGRDAAIGAAVRTLLEQREAGAFPILMAHHPHAFDAAADAQLPLTLSGHTHGGQLMLNEQVGFGPAMFRYWSGLYRKDRSQLIVSNGVGNWFPLRANAPAEIVHLTLRRS
ncbi:MAG TPA: metallophosphoesterase [Chthoniobacterales bacterium]|jgi:predicted MPP superfamily phosphohydrolase|nr:metallophosphoesterase [Chthoniobacterales bacterium]